MIKTRLLKKFLMMLMICLIASNNVFASLNSINEALKTNPPTDRRIKHIYGKGTGAWILHNSFREIQIKDKLFACKEEAIACEKYKQMAIDVKPIVKTYLFENPSWVVGGVAVSFSVGLLLGVIIK